jgi:hemoglobin-like flavoprotein
MRGILRVLTPPGEVVAPPPETPDLATPQFSLGLHYTELAAEHRRLFDRYQITVSDFDRLYRAFYHLRSGAFSLLVALLLGGGIALVAVQPWLPLPRWWLPAVLVLEAIPSLVLPAYYFLQVRRIARGRAGGQPWQRFLKSWASRHPGGQNYAVNTELDPGLIRANLSLILSPGRAPDLTHRFYERLFREWPQTRRLFPTDMRAQEQMLAEALIAATDHLGDSEWLGANLPVLGSRHHGYGVTAEMFGWVKTSLIATLREVSAESWNDSLEAQWGVAIDAVAKLMLEGYPAAS